MNAEMRSLEVLLLAGLIAGGGWWQWRLLRKDCQGPFPARRLFIPLGVSAMVFVGFLFVALLSLADPRKSDFTSADALILLLKALVFALILLSKAELGPLSVASSLGASAYGYLEYGEREFWPIVDLLFDWIFDGSPRILRVVYAALTFLYALVSSIVDEWAEA